MERVRSLLCAQMEGIVRKEAVEDVFFVAWRHHGVVAEAPSSWTVPVDLCSAIMPVTGGSGDG